MHPSGRWITIPLRVSGTRRLAAGPGHRFTGVGRLATHRASAPGGQVVSSGPSDQSLDLASLTADGQPLPDLEVGVIRRLDRLEIDALLGLDFFTQFARIHFDTRALRLVLEADPEPARQASPS